jgi:hypothetical protein
VGLSDVEVVSVADGVDVASIGGPKAIICEKAVILATGEWL